MSRMRIKPDEMEIKVRLTTLEAVYKEAKKKEADVKKEVSSLNEEIKELMLDGELNSFGSLTLTTTQKEDFNEIKAINILKEALSDEDFNKVVRYEPHIDDDALEKLAYNSAFDMSILAPCKTLGKVIHTLRVGK